MTVAKDLIKNIILIALICVGVYVLFPQTINQVHRYLGGLFYPVLIFAFVLVALPWRSKKD